MDDDALEELSFTREPKQKDTVNNISVKAESDLPKFSEWVSGQATQLDTQTITSHVKLMVDVRDCVGGRMEGELGKRGVRGMMNDGRGMMSSGRGMMSGGRGMMSSGRGMMSGGRGMMSGGRGIVSMVIC